MTVVSSLLGVSAFFSASASLAACGLAAAGVSLPTEASAAFTSALSLGFAALSARVFASGLASSDLALRSEERRVGKERRAGGAGDEVKDEPASADVLALKGR